MPSSSSSEPPPPPRASTIGGRFRALDPKQRILLGVFGMVFSGLGLFLSQNLEAATPRGSCCTARREGDTRSRSGTMTHGFDKKYRIGCISMCWLSWRLLAVIVTVFIISILFLQSALTAALSLPPHQITSPHTAPRSSETPRASPSPRRPSACPVRSPYCRPSDRGAATAAA